MAITEYRTEQEMQRNLLQTPADHGSGLADRENWIASALGEAVAASQRRGAPIELGALRQLVDYAMCRRGPFDMCVARDRALISMRGYEGDPESYIDYWVRHEIYSAVVLFHLSHDREAYRQLQRVVSVVG